VLAILLIPAAQVFMFGRMVLQRRHAWAVYAAMFAIFAIGSRNQPARGAAWLSCACAPPA
jgi:K+-transporting ATPase, A chain